VLFSPPKANVLHPRTRLTEDMQEDNAIILGLTDDWYRPMREMHLEEMEEFVDILNLTGVQLDHGVITILGRVVEHLVERIHDAFGNDWDAVPDNPLVSRVYSVSDFLTELFISALGRS
jgi:hypothetical protein